MPTDYQLLDAIKLFGVPAVMGRDVLSAGEVRRMIASQNIIHAYRSRRAAEDLVQWTKDNPGPAELLAAVERIIHDAN